MGEGGLRSPFPFLHTLQEWPSQGDTPSPEGAKGVAELRGLAEEEEEEGPQEPYPPGRLAGVGVSADVRRSLAEGGREGGGSTSSRKARAL